ncbi:hypothetical protein Ahu01nite_036970 [Winogradskya humida]|uniref:Uncharacterized protein n=1 Tax=Winogradskya humida TaxID=113566 RepID=A0ABQ3ZPS9_9ACTN|nr:hypothetical protein Ahu01nite_036970 [Actinoplanes humidus]
MRVDEAGQQRHVPEVNVRYGGELCIVRINGSDFSGLDRDGGRAFAVGGDGAAGPHHEIDHDHHTNAPALPGGYVKRSRPGNCGS